MTSPLSLYTMLPSMRNRTLRGNTVSSSIDILRGRLPIGWRAELTDVQNGQASGRLVIVAPDGRRGDLVLLRRDRFDPRAVLTLQVQHAQTGETLPDLVVAPYLSPEARRRLREAGIGFLDATGNLRVSLVEPGLFIEARGADLNPSPRRRPARSLAGAKAGRIVRALCERRSSWGVRELAAATDTNPGYVSRVLAFLDREALVDRDDKGRVTCADWQRLVRRWAEAAPIETRGRTQLFIAPRGLAPLMQRLGKAKLPHAVTGSFAAARVAPVAPPRLATIYVEEIATVRSVLHLREADAGANVLLIEPKDESVLSVAVTDDEGVRWASLVQVVSDLLTGPGRSPAEAEALMEWMSSHEETWRG